MNDSKKKTAKKIILKNKKEATRILSGKSSDKNQKKKVVQNQKKKTPILKKAKIDNIGKDSEFKAKREKLIINKDDLIKEEPIISFKEKKAKLTTNTSKEDRKKVKNDKKEEKIKLKELKKLEQRKEKLEKEKIKNEKKRLKQEKANEKKLKKAEAKKEKQVISQKKSTSLKKKDIKEKIRNSIFEEEKEEQKEIKQQEKVNRSTRKALITFAIMLLLFLGSIVVVNKLKGRMKSTLNMYAPYKTGELVILKDSSKWYVIADSSADKPTVKLLKELPIDLNENDNIDAGDQIQYSKDGKVEYDSSTEGSIANYLETKYKNELTEKVGKIENVSLLTSEEYVKARSKMGYSYEWSEGNWLASSTLGIWWLGSSKKNGVLVVTPKGNYRLYSVNQQGYVRPVITIDKDLVKKG